MSLVNRILLNCVFITAIFALLQHMHNADVKHRNYVATTERLAKAVEDYKPETYYPPEYP